jgi:flagellar biosynthesis GTPase FlhF
VIARANKTKIEGKGKRSKLVQEWEFAVEENPKAKIIFDLYAGGFLHASSVGFIPREFKKNKDGSTDYYTIMKAELLEVSAVSVPANAAATLAKSVGVDLDELKKVVEVEEDEETPEEEETENEEVEETEDEDTETDDNDESEEETEDEETEESEEDESDDSDEDEEEESEESEEEEVDEDPEPTPEPKAAPKPTRAQVTAKVINRLNRDEERALKAAYATIGKMLNGEGVKNMDRHTGRKVQKRNYHKVIRNLLKAK